METKSADVTEFDTPELHKLVEDMFESMYAAKVSDSRRRRSASANGSR